MIKHINFNDIDLNSKNTIILDVRTQVEHDSCKLKHNHILIPLNELNASDFIAKYIKNNETIYILCKAGVRAMSAAEMFIQAQYKNVVVITGGINTCLGDCVFN